MRYFISGFILLLGGLGAVLYKVEKMSVDKTVTNEIHEPAALLPPQVSPREMSRGDKFKPANSRRKAESTSGGGKQVENCPPGSAYEILACYRGKYRALIKKEGVGAAIADLKSRYGDPMVRSQCHQLAHVIGREAKYLYPAVAEAFRHGDGFCWSGYYHGVMEAIVADAPPSELPRLLDSFCVEIPGKERFSFDYYNCVHGLGHGIMAIHQNELPASLAFCDNLSGGWERDSCWSGAFMENIIADEVSHTAKYLSSDPHYPCNAVDARYRDTCYRMQTSRMLTIVGGDFQKVFGLCREVEEVFRSTCYQSLGRDASGKQISDIAKTRAVCLLGQDEREKSNCIVGAVKDFISYYHSNREARELCETLPAELQSICISTAEDYYRLL